MDTSQWQQGVAAKQARTWAEKDSLSSVSCSGYSQASFPTALCVQSLGRGHGKHAVGLLKVEKNRERTQESVGVKIISFAVRQT